MPLPASCGGRFFRCPVTRHAHLELCMPTLVLQHPNTHTWGFLYWSTGHAPVVQLFALLVSLPLSILKFCQLLVGKTVVPESTPDGGAHGRASGLAVGPGRAARWCWVEVLCLPEGQTLYTSAAETNVSSSKHQSTCWKTVARVASTHGRGDTV